MNDHHNTLSTQRYVNEDIHVDSGPAAAPGPFQIAGMTVPELFGILFKHKWKILIPTALGLAAAAVTFVNWPEIYQSNAKLYIRYVLESQAPTAGGMEDRVQRGEAIVITEREILTSLDLAKQVAATVGPETILETDEVGPRSIDSAAGMIQGNVLATVPKGTSVIHLSFQHPAPDVPKVVLDNLINKYRERHVEVHQSSGLSNEFLAMETERLRARLNQTEDELRKLLAGAGILSFDQSRLDQIEQMSFLRQSIRQAETELIEHKAILSELTKAAPAPDAQEDATPDAYADIPDETLAEYESVTNLLAQLRRREQELLMQYTPGSTMILGVRALIRENEGRKASLEEQYPFLATHYGVDGSSVAGMAGQGRGPLNAATEITRIRALESRIASLNNQLSRLQAEAAEIGEIEPLITELQRRRDLQNKNYLYFSERLEKTKIDEALGTGRVSNISVIQEPSPPRRVAGNLYAVMAGLSVGGLVVGLALAALFELLLDPSIKRSRDIERTVRLPLYLSVPRLKANGKPLLGTPPMLLESGSQNGGDRPPAAGFESSDQLTAWSDDHGLREFFDALRNRLIYNFELRGLVHNPKLVAVTSCGEGAGVSTVAAGLAASLSETGDGNVLLVDMNPEQGRPYYFHRGDLKCGIADVLEKDKRGEALAKDNLYVASNVFGSDVSHIMPKRFGSLVPKFKASDYDYIIFDLPPVNQMTATTQLARHMDLVLMVVEAEETNGEVARRAGDLLAQTGTEVGVVLNKTKSYGPAALQQSHLGNA